MQIIKYYQKLANYPIKLKDIWTGRWIVILEARRYAKRMLKYFKNNGLQ